VIARPGGFLFSELAPAHPPLAHSIYASGLVNIFAYATELAPTSPPLAHSIYASGLVNIFAYATELAPDKPAPGLCGYPSGLVGLCANAHKQCSSEGFSFLSRAPVRGRRGRAGKGIEAY